MATLLNDRDKSLQATAYRSKSTAVTITSTSGGFKTAKNGGSTLALSTSASSIVLTASPNSVFTAAATYTWHYALSATPTTWVLLSTGTTQTITNTAFLAAISTSSQIQYRCTVTEPLLDTAYGYFTLLYTLEPSEPILTSLSRTNSVLVADSSGTINSFANTDTTITVSRGGVAFNYSATAAANSFNVSIDTNQAGGRTVTTTPPTITSTSWTFNGITALTENGAKVVFIITVYDASGNAVSPTIGAQIVYNKVVNGAPGTPGVSGNKYATINAYAWSNTGSAPARNQAFSYNWGTGLPDTYPTGYYASAPSAPGTGYALYQLSLSINDIGSAVNTSANWSTATVNTIGYRIDGSIGPQGQSSRTCYIVTTSETPPTTITPGIGDVPAVGWTFSSTSTLTAGQYMYQSDGILTGTAGDTTSATSIAWGLAYVSNLKVARLSTISADMGVITAGTLTAGTIISGDITGASGNFSGTITGASGVFEGSLLAGTITAEQLSGATIKVYNSGVVQVPADKTTMRITLVGGGGGGGGYNGRPEMTTYTSQGGGGGGVLLPSATQYTNLTPGASYYVTIGAGGAAGTGGDGTYTPGTAGSDGGTTFINPGQTANTATKFAEATGGKGGSYGTTNTGGAAGYPNVSGNVVLATAGTSKVANITETYQGGGQGGGTATRTITKYSGGVGGANLYSTGGTESEWYTPGNPPTGYGGGGYGGGGGYWTRNNFTVPANASAGTKGYAIIEFFNPNSVVLLSDFNNLKTALTQQNIRTTPL